MKIMIDTARDSEEDIRKVIVLLSTIVDRSKQGDIFSAANRGVAPENVFGIFENASQESGSSAATAKKEEKEPFKINGLELY